MSWKKVVIVMAAAMVAAWLGARFADTDGSGGLALAGGASVNDGKSGLVVVTTGATGNDSNRLVMVDTNQKRILVYLLRATYMRLIAARPYNFDLKIYSTDGRNINNNGLGYEETRAMIMNARDLKDEEKEAMPRGREMVLTTDGDAREGNMIVLINPTEQRILVYRLNGNQIGLIAARHFEYDNYKDFYTKGFAPGEGFDYASIRKQVEAMLQARERNP